MNRLFHVPLSPYCRKVRLALAEKRIEVELVEERYWEQDPDFLRRNPAAKVPILRMDGRLMSESQAICEYLDEIHPGDPLMGDTPKARAQIRSWTRWADLNVCEPLANGFRFSEGLPMFQDRMRCVPEAAPGLKACAPDKLEWLDGQLGDRAFLAGDQFSLADILLSSFLAFGEQVGQPLNRELKTLSAWFDRCQARDSAKA